MIDVALHHDDCEAFEGWIILKTLVAARKVKAGLRHAGSGEYQDYLRGTLELGAALDAIDMMANDIVRCIVTYKSNGESSELKTGE